MFAMLRLEEVYLKTVKMISFVSSDNKEVVHDSEASFGGNSPPIQPNCKLVELNTTEVPKNIGIHLYKTENMSFHMNIVEKNMALARRHHNSYAYNGPFLEIDNLHKASHAVIGLRVKQSHYSDQDIETNCVNYPSEKFDYYRDCDEKFTMEEMQTSTAKFL